MCFTPARQDCCPGAFSHHVYEALQPVYRWWLEGEAEATAGMNHPHICQPLFLSRHGDQLAMAMPLAKLGSLSSYLR